MRRPIRFMRQVVYRWPATEPLAPGRPGVEVAPITAKNVEGVLEFRGVRQLDAAWTFLRDGHRGVFAIQNGRVVGHAWITPVASGENTANRYFRLAPGEALIHNCHVAESARGQGAYPLMISSLAAGEVTAGSASVVLIDCSRSNAASIRGIEKAGFRYEGDGFFLLVAGRSVLRLQRLHGGRYAPT